MNRFALASYLAFGLALASSSNALAQRSSASAPARIVAPAPSATSAIPGLRIRWTITPRSVPFDARYAPAALDSHAPRGANGFPAPLVPARITMQLHNDSANNLYVGDGAGDGRAWTVTLSGPGAQRIDTQSNCRMLEIVRAPRMVMVPAHGDAEISLDGLTTGGSCPDSAWFWNARGHYTVRGSLVTTYAVGAQPSDPSSGTRIVLDIPELGFDVT